MLLIVRIFLLSFVFFGLAACKKGKSEVSNLKSLSGFTLDQNSVSVSSKTTPSFTITGHCNSKFNDAEISIDGASSWMPISKIATGATVECGTTGTFSVSVAFTSVTLDSAKWTASNTYNLFFIRGVSTFGYSDAIALALNNTGGATGSITAGSSNTPLTGTGYKLTGEISSFNTSPSTSGGNYKLQGEILW